MHEITVRSWFQLSKNWQNVQIVDLHDNMMQSEAADFALRAATWRTGRNIPVFCDSCRFPPLYGNMTPFTKPEAYNVKGGQSHSHRTYNMYRKFGEIWTCSFWDMWPDRLTDRQTNKQSRWLQCVASVLLMRWKLLHMFERASPKTT